MELAVNIPAQDPQVGAGSIFNGSQLLRLHFAGFDGTDRFKHGNQVDFTSGYFRMIAGQHGAAADKDGGQVQACGSHKHARNDLITVGDHYHGVQGMAGGHYLYGIGDQFTAGQ
jgi:hypothetical protein